MNIFGSNNIAGGISGKGYGMSAKNCLVTGSLKFNGNVNSLAIGGVVGYSEGNSTVKNIVVMGEISDGSGVIAGVAGRTNASNYLFTCSNFYVLKNESINFKLTSMAGKINDNKKFDMIAFFDDLNSNTFTYTDNTSQLSGYDGNILTKLNKYVETQTSEDLLAWKIDNATGKLAFDNM